MRDRQHIETLPFHTDSGLGGTARIGLIVLQTDQTLEYETGALMRGDGTAVYHARIPNETEVTPETLRQMELDLPAAASLLPGSFGFDAIGYGCTSGATMIGEDRVAAIIRQVHPNAKVSNPITACKAALTALGLKRVALVTPYAPSVTIEMQKNLQAAGFEINAVASFDQSDDFTVARISSDSILDAVRTIGARADCDGVFVSCTSLRALPIIATAEAELGKPVLSSNQALGWHLMRLAGLDGDRANAGRLFKTQLTQNR
ncbi:Asp/Glu racemase [Roseovarius sp. M141]|uniref:maleate cis-trans isomerase family protein n=1 Tax=Roseovarius sp. M141 TaxID=2583806 RepID=UPI0020CE3241|nr:Asp/Glu racemase [Roseovarius sp. M141]MCQ0092708.1 Asp/Glu racemase [Roseovarius sp. M141]